MTVGGLILMEHLHSDPERELKEGKLKDEKNIDYDYIIINR